MNTQLTFQYVQQQLIDLANDLRAKGYTVLTDCNPYSNISLTNIVITKGNKHIGVAFYDRPSHGTDLFSVFKYVPRVDTQYIDHPTQPLVIIYSNELHITADQLINMMVDTPVDCNDFVWLSKYLVGDRVLVTGQSNPKNNGVYTIGTTTTTQTRTNWLADVVKDYFAPLVAVKNSIKNVIKSIFG